MSSNTNTAQGRFSLGVTSLSQFIRLQNCERFLRFRLFPQEMQAFLDRWNLTIQPLTPLLEDAGSKFEEQVEAFLSKTGDEVIRLETKDPDQTVELLKNAKEPTLLFQPPLTGIVGGIEFSGLSDIIRVNRRSENGLDLHVCDIKASRKERMEHRLQVALYITILEKMAEKAGVQISNLTGSVLHMEENGVISGWDPDNPGIDLPTYRMVLERLLTAEDCLVKRIAAGEFEDAFYHLNYHCDGCMYNAICMYDSAERYDLSLISSLTAAEKRAFQMEGVTQIQDLAHLMALPAKGSRDRELKVAQGQERLYRQLQGQWSIAPKLPVLVQKAQSSLKHLDPSVESAPFIFNSGFSSLPSDESSPGLIKIFFDAQKDYLQDRLYMISSLISGPGGERVIVECASGPPSAEDERDLLLRWIRGTLLAVAGVAGSDLAPLHLYCYDRFDQKIVLEALKRHLDDVAAVPGFFDLMTQSPALEQSMVSFLADELRDRKNLGLVCMPLHDAARMRGFDWQDDFYKYYELFRARLFDNRRNVIRKEDGSLSPVPGGSDLADQNIQRIESASRFNSQIPLEYAYAAWDLLPENKKDEKLLEPFRQVDLMALQAFAGQRAKALAYLEAKISPKNDYLDKPLLSIPEITQDSLDSSLVRSLKDFLYIEHHTSLQNKLMIYRLPIEQRVQTGLSLLLKCQAKLPDDKYRFWVESEGLGLDHDLVMNACRLKEGSWVVVNEVSGDVTPGRIKHGRLGIVEEQDDQRITVQLLGITFRNGTFRYYHNNRLEPNMGEYYTIDEMADDINADKILLALDNAHSNTLYRWLSKSPEIRQAGGKTQFLEEFTALIDQVGGKKRLTKKQKNVIVDDVQDPLILVQGPPGTGKSVTLAWSVISRLALSASRGQTLRVAVCCKTHNAANIVLKAIYDQLKSVSGFALSKYGLDKLKGTRIVKIVNDLEDIVPTGVEPFAPYPAGSAEREELLNESWVVIGGTPGGVYNLRRYQAGRVKDINWEKKTFDLLVIDEASQMSVPEGMLSAAFLKKDGQIIVVGDHRQMPPIVAHDWEEEERRNIQHNEPYKSLFEFLRNRGFPCEGLDQSFRLHEVIAKFLHENIYHQDGIRFISKRKTLLTTPPPTNDYVDAVLDPGYPIVVVEHNEHSSQQYNQTEIELARPLIDVCAHQLSLNGTEGIGVVVPHRAQRALLRKEFPELAAVDSIDTVEKFQGGERDVIIVSATASDPDFVLAEADFLLNINRLNVALSRPRMKLIVIASQSVVDLLTSDLDVFQNAVLWKQLYHRYTPDLLYEGSQNGTRLWVRGKAA